MHVCRAAGFLIFVFLVFLGRKENSMYTYMYACLQGSSVSDLLIFPTTPQVKKKFSFFLGKKENKPVRAARSLVPQTTPLVCPATTAASSTVPQIEWTCEKKEKKKKNI